MTDERAPIGAFPSELTLDSQSGPAPYITRSKADALIFAALDEAGFGTDAEFTAGVANDFDASTPVLLERVSGAPSPLPVDPPTSVPSTRTSRRLSAPYLAAAIALLACLGVGSASAAVLWYARAERSQAAVPVPAPIKAASKPAVRRAAPVVAASAPTQLGQLPTLEIMAEPPKHERRAPEDLLVEGNRLRAEKRWSKADDAYTRAFQSAPDSQAAYVARVASAAVRLEHLGDAKGALARYREALRQAPQGRLSEEIQLGIADAQRALGDREAEQASLRTFLRAYPKSPLAAQAQARLE